MRISSHAWHKKNRSALAARALRRVPKDRAGVDYPAFADGIVSNVTQKRIAPGDAAELIELFAAARTQHPAVYCHLGDVLTAAAAECPARHLLRLVRGFAQLSVARETAWGGAIAGAALQAAAEPARWRAGKGPLTPAAASELEQILRAAATGSPVPLAAGAVEKLLAAVLGQSSGGAAAPSLTPHTVSLCFSALARAKIADGRLHGAAALLALRSEVRKKIAPSDAVHLLEAAGSTLSGSLRLTLFAKYLETIDRSPSFLRRCTQRDLPRLAWSLAAQHQLVARSRRAGGSAGARGYLSASCAAVLRCSELFGVHGEGLDGRDLTLMLWAVAAVAEGRADVPAVEPLITRIVVLVDANLLTDVNQMASVLESIHRLGLWAKLKKRAVGRVVAALVEEAKAESGGRAPPADDSLSRLPLKVLARLARLPDIVGTPTPAILERALRSRSGEAGDLQHVAALLHKLSTEAAGGDGAGGRLFAALVGRCCGPLCAYAEGEARAAAAPGAVLVGIATSVARIAARGRAACDPPANEAISVLAGIVASDAFVAGRSLSDLAGLFALYAEATAAPPPPLAALAPVAAPDFFARALRRARVLLSVAPCTRPSRQARGPSVDPAALADLVAGMSRCGGAAAAGGGEPAAQVFGVLCVLVGDYARGYSLRTLASLLPALAGLQPLAARGSWCLRVLDVKVKARLLALVAGVDPAAAREFTALLADALAGLKRLGLSVHVVLDRWARVLWGSPIPDQRVLRLPYAGSAAPRGRGSPGLGTGLPERQVTPSIISFQYPDLQEQQGRLSAVLSQDPDTQEHQGTLSAVFPQDPDLQKQQKTLSAVFSQDSDLQEQQTLSAVFPQDPDLQEQQGERSAVFPEDHAGEATLARRIRAVGERRAGSAPAPPVPEGKRPCVGPDAAPRRLAGDGGEVSPAVLAQRIQLAQGTVRKLFACMDVATGRPASGYCDLLSEAAAEAMQGCSLAQIAQCLAIRSRVSLPSIDSSVGLVRLLDAFLAGSGHALSASDTPLLLDCAAVLKTYSSVRFASKCVVQTTALRLSEHILASADGAGPAAAAQLNQAVASVFSALKIRSAAPPPPPPPPRNECAASAVDAVQRMLEVSSPGFDARAPDYRPGRRDKTAELQSARKPPGARGWARVPLKEWCEP
ncbi:hypothetical protein DIPPA_23108 [Diplonema papillatum]|nr:hypothetical protein DIPPA_23108 [Diplonema papillatum]